MCTLVYKYVTAVSFHPRHAKVLRDVLSLSPFVHERGECTSLQAGTRARRAEKKSGSHTSSCAQDLSQIKSSPFLYSVPLVPHTRV